MEDSCSAVPGVTPEHGLSIYMETEKHRLLMDTGASPLTWENAAHLGVDLSSVDTVIISHGHYDHAGGLLSFSRENPGAQIYMQKSADGDFYHRDRYIGIDKEILGLPGLHLLEGDLRIDEELSLFTNITGRRLWPRANRSLTIKRNGVMEQDPFTHEQCLVVKSGGKQVLFSGCAHNGILNTLDRFHELYEGEPDLILGGFHTIKKQPYTEEEVRELEETARILKELPGRCITGHCTGENALSIMGSVMGEKLVRLYAGLEITV